MTTAAARRSCHASASFELRKSHFFLQRRAALPIIETQKSPWSVSDVDRRETGLFPRKTKTSLPGSFFFLSEPFQLGEADVCQSTGDSTGGRAHSPTAVTIRGLVYEWLDPRHVLELQEARQVLEGAPQPCSAARQHAPAVHQAVLADEHTRSQRRPRREHRRDLLPPPAGASDRGVKQAQLWGNTKEATTFTVAFSLDRGPLDMLIEQAVKTDAVLPEEAHSPRHVGERLGHHGDHDPAVHSHIGQRAEPEQRRRSVDPSLGHGQHPRQRGHDDRHEGEVHVVLCFIPPRSTSYLQPCDVAVFRRPWKRRQTTRTTRPCQT